MNHASLFTGIGGFDLAAEWMGWNNIFQVEINKFCQTKLIKNFPDVRKYTDIKLFDGKPYANRIDVLTGGFPCQTFSVAGKGTTDLTLWKEMFRTITEIKPPYVVAENVPGIISRKNSMAFNVVCSDLENFGYEIQPLNIPIAGKGAPHKRERIWFIAYSDRFRCNNEQKENGQTLQNGIRDSKIEKQSRRKFKCGISKSNINATDNNSLRELQSKRSKQDKWQRISNNSFNHSNTKSKGLERREFKEKSRRKQSRQFRPGDWDAQWIEVASRLCRVDARIPNRMDRIISLGNSISPILAYEYFKCIDETNKRMRAVGCCPL